MSTMEQQVEQAILSGVDFDGIGSNPELIRQIKQSGSPQFRVKASTPEEEEGRIVRFVASDETPDRVGDVIEVAGWNLTNYKANPVVLWGHDSSNTPPIGRSVNVRRGVGPSGAPALLASIEFAPAEAHEFADSVYQLTKAGYLNAVSVGFQPRATKELTKKERQELGMPSYGLFYTSADLLEISVVSVPANPSALVTGAKSLVDSGLLQGREVERFLKQIPMTNQEMSERLKSKIRGFVDLGALSASSSAKGLSEPEDAISATTKPFTVAPKGLKHISAVEETEDAFILTYLKADYEEEEAEEEEMEEGEEPEEVVPEGYSEDDEEDEPTMGSRMVPALAELVSGQTEQAKALTNLIDAVSDLTKRIHSMGEKNSGEQRGCAVSPDAVSSDAQHESQREEKAHIEQLTNDFLNRLQAQLR